MLKAEADKAKAADKEKDAAAKAAAKAELAAKKAEADKAKAAEKEKQAAAKAAGKEKGTEEVPPMQRMLYICMEMMVFMERRLVKSERNNASTVVGIVDYEEFKLRPKHAQTVVQNVIKTFGASNYSGNERNAFEAWTNFKAQIESAVKSYPKLLELVKEEVIGDVVSKRNLASAFATAATASWLQELPEEAPTEEIVATTHGLLKTNDEKKRTCAVCASGGRATEACWQTNSTAMEVYDGELEVTHGLYDRLCDLKLMSTNSEARYHILHTNNVTGVPEASRAVDIKEWLLQYDDRLTVSESDLSVYFIDVPNALVVQLHSFINAVECITSSEDWKTSLLTAFNAKWSRS
eukprot:gene9372-11107_t